MKDPRAIVAVIIAVTTMGTLWSGVGLNYMYAPDELQSPDYIVDFWREIVLVLIGALAGYIGGGSK